MSQSTAKLLIKAGKDRWVSPREDPVIAKGKGVMKTFWVDIRGNNGSPDHGKRASLKTFTDDEYEDDLEQDGIEHVKHNRLVDWMVELLQEHIRKVVARYQVMQKNSRKFKQAAVNLPAIGDGKITLDEVAEIITMPKLDTKLVMEAERIADSVELSPQVYHLLHTYVSTIASAYRNNHFHNFEHAYVIWLTDSKLEGIWT